MGQMSFFDADDRLKSFSRLGDPLEPLNAVMPWEDFRPLLSQVREKARKSNAGRKPFDVVFMRFLGLGVEDRVPDATTVWRFREDLKEQNLMERLFHRCLGRTGADPA
jgi:IS5 family transposase